MNCSSLRFAVCAILPLFVALAGCEARSVLSGYKSYTLPGGGKRFGAHAGVDFAGNIGDPVIAAADGVLFSLSGIDFVSNRGCGRGVILRHNNSLETSGVKYTVYCHLDRFSSHIENHTFRQPVRRGEVIGYVGKTGNAMEPHIHFEVNDDGISHSAGQLAHTEDPFKYIVGCYDPKVTYPKGQFVLTYPMPC